MLEGDKELKYYQRERGKDLNQLEIIASQQDTEVPRKDKEVMGQHNRDPNDV